MSKEMAAQRQMPSSTQSFIWELVLSTKRNNDSFKGIDGIDMVPSPMINLSGKRRMSMKPTKKRGI